MESEIIAHLNDPGHLEKMYRTDRAPFRQAFNALYPQLKGNTLADFWNERLNYHSDDIYWGSMANLIFVIIASLAAGVIAKLPAIFGIDEAFFYPRNIGFIIFPVLSAYFAWKNKLGTGKIAVLTVLMLIGLIFINVFPDVNSDTLVLSCIHLPLFLYSLLGFAFVDQLTNKTEKRLGYLKYNGDLIVITGLILAGGVIMTGVTIGLFNLIGFNIEQFYFEYVVVFGLSAAPIVGTYLTQANPHMVGKVSPVIARIFSPLVLVMLSIYLAAIIYSGKNPYNDREFLLIFNALLVGVMAIIFFSVAETKSVRSLPEIWALFLLSLLTIIVNSIALSAIMFRISEWGITPNRSAVLGGNVLILINLLMVSWKLFKVVSKKGEIGGVGKAIALYLPVYILWAVIVTFIFPLIFGFK